jgi:hypothetical protein
MEKSNPHNSPKISIIKNKLEKISIKESFDADCIKRVRQMLEFEAKNPRFHKPWNKLFVNIEDYALYKKLHSEWSNKSVKEIQTDTKSGGKAFYAAVHNFSKNKSEGDKEKQRKLIGNVFEFRQKDWSSFTTIDDFKTEYKKHPEWHGKSAKEIESIKGGSSFYQALLKYSRKTAKGNKRKQKDIMSSFFNYKRKDWSSFTSIEDFQDEFNKHPEWHDMSIDELSRDRLSGGCAYYGALRKFATRESKKSELEAKDIIYKIIQPKLKDWSSFKTIEDFLDEFNKHTEWQGLAANEMKHDKKHGGSKFYYALRGFVKKEDKDTQIEIMRLFFEPKLRDWSSFKKIEDFKTEYEKHPEWHGLSANEMKNDNKHDGSKFYYALLNFARNESNGNKKIQSNVIQQFFEPQLRDWSEFTTVEDFIEEYKKHPEWHGKSTFELQKIEKKSGSAAFLAALYKFAKTKSEGNNKKQTQIINQVIEKKYQDWSLFKSVNDFINEYKKHPEWHGKSTGEITKDTKYGGYAFYAALRTFAKKSSKGNEEKRKAIIRSIFPERKAPFLYTFGKKTIYFDSYPERIVGLLLYKYGLINDFVEGQNFHVLTSKGGKRNSIDFLISETFLEYHPLGIMDKKRGYNLKQAGQRKRKNITRPCFKGYDFYHIWEIEQLYKILKHNHIKKLMKSKYKNISKKEFNRHLLSAYKSAIQFDAKIKQY